MDINEIKNNDTNPRKISDESLDKLSKSIKDFPKMMEIRPIVIDNNNIIIGGNMRFLALKKLGYKEIPDCWIKRADKLTEDEKREFIIKDNAPFGEWDMDVLFSDWGDVDLKNWGLFIDEFNIDESLGEEFTLPDGDKEPFQQMTFTLADEQAEIIKNAISEIKKTDEFKYCETMGNENGNGNALYLIISQWEGQRR